MPGSAFNRYGGYRNLRGECTGYFHLEKLKGHWWLIDPEGCTFLTLGVNHMDPNALKYEDNVHIWREKYDSSLKNWCKGVARDMKDWGFNTISWTEEMVASDFRHSPDWTYEMYQWADIPYVHKLPMLEIESWNPRAYYPDLKGEEFEQWCDFVARSACVDMADDPKCIGYSLSARPDWFRLLEQKAPGTDSAWHQWYGIDVSVDSGIREYRDLMKGAYRIVVEAIRRYDQKHLLFGHRLTAEPQGSYAPLENREEHWDFVFEILDGTYDLLSMNYFYPDDDLMLQDFDRWHQRTGKPIIHADFMVFAPTGSRTKVGPIQHPCEDQLERGQKYGQLMDRFFAYPWFIGWHMCSYIENKVRGHGYKDRFDNAYTDCTDQVAIHNRSIYQKLEG